MYAKPMQACLRDAPKEHKDIQMEPSDFVGDKMSDLRAQSQVGVQDPPS